MFFDLNGSVEQEALSLPVCWSVQTSITADKIMSYSSKSFHQGEDILTYTFYKTK